VQLGLAHALSREALLLAQWQSRCTLPCTDQQQWFSSFVLRRRWPGFLFLIQLSCTRSACEAVRGAPIILRAGLALPAPARCWVPMTAVGQGGTYLQLMTQPALKHPFTSIATLPDAAARRPGPLAASAREHANGALPGPLANGYAPALDVHAPAAAPPAAVAAALQASPPAPATPAAAPPTPAAAPPADGAPARAADPHAGPPVPATPAAQRMPPPVQPPPPAHPQRATKAAPAAPATPAAQRMPAPVQPPPPARPPLAEARPAARPETRTVQPWTSSCSDLR
jgi:hypothetical protein